ncbi:MAG: M20/M25/M40 family metallo-hydrolase [Woeseiaceae bacterium]|nr:M20/M25/M40 family metallo-hydrolase [Woeseiaceae bacterium]
MRHSLTIATLLGLGLMAQAVADPLPVDTIRALAENHKKQAIELYREFLSLPNDANYPDDIQRLVEWMETAFSQRRFDVQRIATAGSPLLFAERRISDQLPTVLIYLQADGQPVDPSAWFQEDPYTPVLKEPVEGGGFERIPWGVLESAYDPDWRVFARSASDSKGPMAQFMVAMDLFDQAGFEFAYNMKVIIDTEEEMGSPNLPDAVLANRDLLASDMLLIFDGPPHPSNKPTVGFGARGIVTITLVTYGPKVPQHSGHYGNFVPNPAFHMTRILSSMKSADGRVTIPGFYDGVSISDEVRAVLEAVPDNEEQILRDMGLIKHDAVAPSLQEAIQYPSLNIRGLSSGWVGKESRTIIPATATAEIDMRLVKESDYRYLLGLVRSHIEDLGYYVIDREPTDAERLEHADIVSFTHEFSYSAYRSDMDAAAGRLARAGMRHLYGEEPILIRTSGGSVPISPFVETLGVPAAKVPTVNIDNNQHSPNENIRLGNFIEGIAILMSVLSQTPD